MGAVYDGRGRPDARDDEGARRESRNRDGMDFRAVRNSRRVSRPERLCWAFRSWRDADGRAHVRHVTDAALQGEAGPLSAMLASDGLAINRSQQRAFAVYLSGATVKGRVTVVSRTGWHLIGADAVFVLANETIGPRGAERAILDAAALGPDEARGSLDDWKEGVGALARGHALPILAISTALAGPLLHLAGQEGGGLNIFGGSSKGKTTILQAAGSVWGPGRLARLCPRMARDRKRIRGRRRIGERHGAGSGRTRRA